MTGPSPASTALVLVSVLAGSALPRPAAAAPATAPKYTIHWFIGHRNLDYFEEAAADFKQAVEERSRGEIAVEITSLPDGGSELSPQADRIPGRVARGEAEMGHSFVDVMGALDPRLHAFEAPYLFRGYPHMEGILEGPIGNELLAGLKTRHLVGLSFTYSGGANGVATKERELRRPEDLRGLRVGVYGDAVNGAWLKELGATPVAIGHRLEAILPSDDDKSLDAVVITWRNFERTGLERGFKFMSLMGSSYLVSVTYINDKFFASLPQAYQTLLLEESRKAGRIERAKTIDLNERAKREMLAKDVRPVHLGEKGRQRFVEALQPAYRRIDPILGRELRERIQRTPDSGEHPSLISRR